MKYYSDGWLTFTLDIVNSYDPFFEVPEQLSSPNDLNSLFRKHDIFSLKTSTFEDVLAIRTYRDELRSLIQEGNDSRLVEFLVQYESKSPMQLRLSTLGNGRFTFVYEQHEKAPLINQILALCSFSLGKELVEYGRGRLKSCISKPCEEIFIDRSKNGRQRFCSKKCSNRFHVQKHRQLNT
ncbi:CGNR zinc finger domain-containing protein [Evansella halocellulosilytica]|uniref:CGNR zinc finger domain-containing protein n=1 Tax=Evansella halocellulosilytica TaxID=2011013 RepID=UPI000BB95AAE|nr:CGNR zinc finger domain-containing protein [Evansella halocellulosilytica]